MLSPLPTLGCVANAKYVGNVVWLLSRESEKEPFRGLVPPKGKYRWSAVVGTYVYKGLERATAIPRVSFGHLPETAQ
jgi:hypothetical protein